MRDLLTLAEYAISLPGCGPNTPFAGAFSIPVPATGARLRVIASAVWGWDHVSVSHPARCPNWPEMCRMKALFFFPHECAMQLHVPDDEHINNHATCLHLFRPHDVEIPRPPAEFVGVSGMSSREIVSLSPDQRLALRDQAAHAMTAKGMTRG